ncbi:MAG: nuclear transport factor 2 family protein [Caulobacterales bacterium]|nr:nuclear transport factor 2 family protein [Caulobacterales bacterium]
MTSKIEVLRSVIAAWRDRQDIDAVISHLTEDCVWHYSAVTAPPKVGHEGARAFLTAFRERVRNPRWRIFAYAENDDALFIEGVDEFDTPDGNVVQVPYMGVLEFRGDKICRWRDYFDRGVADRGAKGEALPDHAAALLDRAEVA